MFQNTGVLIDHGAIHVVVILPLLIFGASVFVGGTLSTKLPAPNTSLVNILPLSQQPSKAALQLYSLEGVTLTPPPPQPTTPQCTPAPTPITSGKTYYVAQNSGSDSHSCDQAKSSSTPKRTINAGIGCLNAGDTLYVKAGTYAETLDADLGTPFASGTSWTNPVTIAGSPGDTVTIQPPPGRVFALAMQSGALFQYLIFDNLIFDGSNLSNTVVKFGSSGAQHIRIQNSEVRNSPTQMGILLAGSADIEMLNLNIRGNAQYGIYNSGQNTLMDHLDVHDNGGYGLHIYADGGNVNSNTVRNSRIHDNGFHQRQCYGGCTQPGMVVASGAGNAVYNNLIYNNGATGIQVDYGAINTGIYNNTIYGNGGPCVTLGGVSATIIRNNICFNNNTGIVNAGKGATIDHNYTADPQFVNPPNDFHLQPSSSAKTASDKGGEVGAYGNGTPCVGANCAANSSGGDSGKGRGIACQSAPALADIVLTDCGRELRGSQKPQMLWALTRGSLPASGGRQEALKAFYTDDSTLLLGAGAGVSAMKQSPADTVVSPALGDKSRKDTDNLPYFPSLFITDITTNPNATTGDAQDKGQPNKPDGIYGVWKAKGMPDSKPSTGQNRTSTSDPWPASNGVGGPRGTAFTAEVVWKLSALKGFDPVSNQLQPLKSGHTYRVQAVLHNGENPPKVGVTCFTVTMP